MKIKILQSASDDLIDGYWFYEKQEVDLGSYFLDTLFSEIESLKIYAGIHSKFDSDYYRMFSHRFPFAIYYKIEDDSISIYAVLDCRRDPAWIREKLL